MDSNEQQTCTKIAHPELYACSWTEIMEIVEMTNPSKILVSKHNLWILLEQSKSLGASVHDKLFADPDVSDHEVKAICEDDKSVVFDLSFPSDAFKTLDEMPETDVGPGPIHGAVVSLALTVIACVSIALAVNAVIHMVSTRHGETHIQGN